MLQKAKEDLTLEHFALKLPFPPLLQLMQMECMENYQSHPSDIFCTTH